MDKEKKKKRDRKKIIIMEKKTGKNHIFSFPSNVFLCIIDFPNDNESAEPGSRK